MCECPADKIQNPCARLRELEAALTLTEALLLRERELSKEKDATIAEMKVAMFRLQEVSAFGGER